MTRLYLLFILILSGCINTADAKKEKNPDVYANDVYAKKLYADELYIGNKLGNMHVTTSKSGDVILGFYNNDQTLKPGESARIEISLNSSTGPTITLRNGEAFSAAGVMVIKLNNGGDPSIFMRSPRGVKSIDLQLRKKADNE